MFNYFRKELDWGGRKLVLETGKIARQADGAVLARYGDTIVLCTAVGVKTSRPGQDFFPLTVNYQEKAFAAGKIPGGFFKREGRPEREAEVLKSRLIDRPIRPLFPDGFRNEVQVVATVLSHDLENDPDIVALIGCSAALTLSGIPFFGPVAAARVGYSDGQYILNPTADQMTDSKLELVVAGTAEGVLMVESEAQELSEDVMLGAVTFGHTSFQPVIQAIIELAEHAAKEPWALPEPSERGAGAEGARRRAGPRRPRRGLSRAGQARPPRQGRRRAQGRWPRRWPPRGWTPRRPRPLFHDLEADIVRNAILDTGLRIDGRDTKTVRPIVAEVGVLPRAHGSRAVHPRRDAGVLRRHARHRPGRADHRRAGRRVPRALHAALQFPALLGGRGGPHGLARAGARSATASWPGGRSIRCCRRRRSSPTRCAWSREITESQRLVLDGDGLRQLAGADGRRRAAEAAGGRHRHGPDQGGPRLRRAVRHPGRRGPSRRHGLQGGRHRGRHHRAADGHQDHLDHAGDHADRAGAGARRPDAHPGRDVEGDHRRARRRRRDRAAHHHHQRAEGEDPRGHRHRRQGDPRDRRADRAARSTSTTTARSRSPPPTSPRRSRRSTGSAASSRSRRSA